jgi:hypothetical protein
MRRRRVVRDLTRREAVLRVALRFTRLAVTRVVVDVW